MNEDQWYGQTTQQAAGAPASEPQSRETDPTEQSGIQIKQAAAERAPLHAPQPQQPAMQPTQTAQFEDDTPDGEPWELRGQQDAQPDATDAPELEIRYDDRFETEHGIEIDEEVAGEVIDQLGDMVGQDDVDVATNIAVEHIAHLSSLDDDQALEYIAQSEAAIAERHTPEELAAVTAWVDQALPPKIQDWIFDNSLHLSPAFVTGLVHTMHTHKGQR